MAAQTLPKLVPTSYITYTGTAPTTTTVGNIDNGVATPDAAFLAFAASSTSTAFYDITTTPSDFSNIVTLTYNIRYKITPLAGDTETLSVRIFKADQTTPLTNAMLVVSTTTAIATLTNKGNTAFTDIDTSATKADWDGAVLAIITTHNVSGGKDNSIWSIDEVEVNGTYNTFPTVVLNSPSDAATGQSTTPALQFTGTDAQSDNIEYEIQVDTINTFDSVVAPTYLKSVNVWVGINGAPVDNVYIEIRLTSYNGSIIGTTNSLNGSTIGTSMTKLKFTFSTPIVLNSNTQYCLLIKRSGGADATNYYRAGYDSTGAYPDGILGSGTISYSTTGDLNLILTDYEGTDILNTFLGIDMSKAFGMSTTYPNDWQTFKLSKYGSLLDKFSTTGSGFTAGHPFASAFGVTYTVQSALENSKLYYWRVRGSDASGYGAWSSIRSFTTEALSSNDEIVGTSTLTFASSSAIQGKGQVIGSAPIVFSQVGAIRGKGAVVGSSSFTFAGSSAIRGKGAVVGNSLLTFASSTVIKAKGTIAGISTVTFAGSTIIRAKGNMAGNSPVAFAGSSAIRGKGAVAGSSPVVFSSSANLSIAGSVAHIIGTTTLTFSQVAGIRGKGKISGNTLLTFGNNSVIKGKGKIAGSTSIVFNSNAVIAQASAVGHIVGSTILTFATSITIRGKGKIIATAPITFVNNSAIRGKAIIAGNTTLTFVPTGVIRGKANVAGSSIITFNLLGDIYDVGALVSSQTIIGTIIVDTISGNIQSINLIGNINSESVTCKLPSVDITGKITVENIIGDNN